MVTIAVDDSESPAPSNSAGVIGMPNSISSKPSSAVLISTCWLPRRNTTWRRAIIFDRENSRPSENNRNTTPSSATSGKCSLSLTQSNALGPTSNPTHR
ncbi:hypothetical protein D3C81_1508330 [compost metagenome]